jgi:hypothetical protein
MGFDSIFYFEGVLFVIARAQPEAISNCYCISCLAVTQERLPRCFATRNDILSHRPSPPSMTNYFKRLLLFCMMGRITELKKGMLTEQGRE